MAKKRYALLFLFFICLVLFVYILRFAPGPGEEKTDEENSPPYEAEFIPEDNDPGAGIGEIDCRQGDGEEEFFLGICGEWIAVYSRLPDGGAKLKEVLPYPVQRVYYDELTKGIPFRDQEEKLLLLENLTS